MTKNKFKDSEKEILLNEYLTFRNIGKLQELADRMGRTKQFICRQAKYLGLTDRVNKISMKPFAAESSLKRIEWHKRNPHPKGFLGKNHSKETKEICGLSSRIMWGNPDSKGNSEIHREKLSDRMIKFRSDNPNKITKYSRVKHGSVEIGGKVFFARSSWEANIAAYLNFLKSYGEITDWFHEPETFWFNEIKRGVRSYLPDFKVINKDGTEYFIEVKGWLDDKSKTKLNRMRIYYPSVKLELIDEKRYKSIKKNAALIKDWGKLDADDFLPAKRLCGIDGCENKHHTKGLCRKHFYQSTKKLKN